MDLLILDIAYKWNHITFDLLCLALFTQRDVFKFYPHCSMCRYIIPFLWLNNILLYGWTTLTYQFIC